LTTPASAPASPLERLGEHGIIRLIRERFPDTPGFLPIGIGDDAAVAVPQRGALEVLTTDSLVEGIHFDRAFCSMADVGYKALAVNVSDVAAMGGTPRLALLSLILPVAVTPLDIDGLLTGFAAMAREAKVALAGGNIARSPGPLVVDVTVVGAVHPRKVLTRSGGRPGDALYVTGSIGGPAAALGWLKSHGAGTGIPDPGELAASVERYRRPQTRHRLGALLGRTRAASACMDLSDGLADAVTQLAAASGTGAVVRAADLPIPAAASRWFSSRGDDPVAAAVAGGDDYELLFAVPARRKGRLRTVLQQSRGVGVTKIGELTEGGAAVLDLDGIERPLPSGFSHF
jgi:thiamine-monophosphate kinase